MYKIFNALSLILCIIATIKFYPNYYENEFPLFTDITTVFIFLPSYFILTISILGQTIYIFIKRKGTKVISLFLLFVITFIYSFTFFPYKLNIVVSSICIIIGIAHFFIALILYNKKYNKK